MHDASAEFCKSDGPIVSNSTLLPLLVHHFSDHPPPLGEGPSHPELPQDLGQTNIVISEMLQVVNNSVPDPLDDTLQALGGEPSHPEQHQDSGETHAAGVPQVVITAIRATNLTLGLRRIPVSFHVAVQADGAEFRTSNKPVHVDQAILEWNECILLPCDPSSIIRVTVYASFELGPMLCQGEVLRTFEISVRELLDRSGNSHPIVFQPEQGEVVSPCTSLFMTLEQRLPDEKDAAVLCSLNTLAAGDMDALMLRTDAGHGLLARYRRMQNRRDLDQSINHFEHALDICPMDHPCRPAALFNLATAKLINCQANETYPDLDIPISVFQDALRLRPTGHPDRPITQLHLAIVLLSRFAKRGFQADVDAAEELLSEVLDVCHANSHIRRAALLAIETSGCKHPTASINAHELGQEWSAASMLPLSPNQLAHRTTWCLERDDPRALDEVISLHYDALGYYSSAHARRGQLVCNLSLVLHACFERRGNAEDLDQAIALQREALALRPVGLDGTGGPGEGTDLNVAMHHFEAAANFVPGGLLGRLRASLRWVRHAGQHRHYTELEAYGTSMQLMDAYMCATASVSSRHRAMKDFPRMLAVNAASCALRGGDDYHMDPDDNAAALMKRFRELSSLLDRPPVSHTEGAPSVNVEAENTRYRRLVEDWNGVVEEIRKIEGFSRFLLPPVFADLQEAARDGPIIMLIASQSSCDAIIIPYKQSPTSIRLPTNLEKLQTLVVKLQCTSRSALPKALMELWDDVIRPVVDILGGFARQHSRIWWCPTSVFNFLPLHAAGEYRKDGQFLSQLYISSYTPSLAALIKARTHDRSLSVSFAAIGQDHPPGVSFTLDCVERELELVRSLLPPLPTVSFTKITSVDATRSRALHALQDNTWLHFSCHGTQNYEDPFNSAFLMRDQPLSLLDITQTDLSRHEFAFLSACDTAAGDPSTPDEVIHLAAGLQFAGVKSVVGTLWKVTDATVQRLVEEFYKNFCKDGKMNSKRAAQALHQAVHSLASDKDMALDQRIVFVHIGI
ncbi:hypothetical protein P692DRAFT_201853098 [Suillus brevipes Sb2]|nr:hypothetical protein P692DRAFT_201853098 [Suillus brevipes Sb2]